MMATIVGDLEKLGELILYVSQKCADDPLFGSVKLNKILYLSDFLAFGMWNTPITAVEYQHLAMGPAPRHLLTIRSKLEQEHALAIQEVRMGSGKIQKRTRNLREAKLDSFTAKEIALVDRVIDLFLGKDAEETSELSHRFVGWKMTKEGEGIPYGTIFLSDEPLSEAEVVRGQQLAKELGLSA